MLIGLWHHRTFDLLEHKTSIKLRKHDMQKNYENKFLLRSWKEALDSKILTWADLSLKSSYQF